MDGALKRKLLKPMASRKWFKRPENFLAALERLEGRAENTHELSELIERLSGQQARGDTPQWQDPDAVRDSVAFAKLLYASRKISRQEFVLFGIFPVESIHDHRWTQGLYDHDLREVREAMEAVERSYDIGPDQFWRRADFPPEYKRLDEQYNLILKTKFISALREFGLDDLASLNENNPRQFERLREHGRRSVFHCEDIAEALEDLVHSYENDARRAASAKAYSAAITSLGAGLEGLLLLRCLKDKDEAVRIAGNLPKGKPRDLEDLTTWSFDHLIKTCSAAGWLPSFSTPAAKFLSAGLAHQLRQMRNYVHPGRHVREKPWLEPEEEDYKDAEAIYLALLPIAINAAGRRD
jgi:hypothetical protein